MPDEIRVTGSVDLVEVVKTLHHAVKEMGRLGDFVKEEGDKTDAKFDRLTAAIASSKADLKADIAAIDKAQSLTDREMKIRIASFSAAAATAVTVVLAILKAALPALLRGVIG